MANQTPTFHLGITMAGAVSAGAYTAGAIDYLLEALAKWEEYRKKAPTKIPVPPHRVVIDVVGGGSAGGVIAALTALACKVGIEPVKNYNEAKQPGYKPKNNLLFEAWVNMVDETDGKNTFAQMLETEDLKDGKIPSLLNSEPINKLAENALEAVKGKWNSSPPLPPYIAKDLDILLTLCSLKGIPIGIDFSSDSKGNQSTKPSYQMQTHKLLARFNYQAPNQAHHDESITLDDEKALQQLIDCAKSTAAFPIGLAARKIGGFSKAYLKKQFGTFMGFKEESLNEIFNEAFEDPFTFTSIDGGTLNNEPFGETEILLKKGTTQFPENSGIILIDPFPNFTDSKAEVKPEEEIDSLEELVGPIFSTLRHQGTFKETDIRDEIESTGKVKKNMIFPSRRTPEGNKVAGNHLACGALDGFSGFIERKFRVHDYFLGRKNCRNFLRFYFVLEHKKGEKLPDLFKGWTEEMLDYYGLPDKDKEGCYKLPIIPCFDFIEKVEEEKTKNPTADISKLNWEVGHDREREFPKINVEDLLDKYEASIENRAKAILKAFTEIMKKQDEPGKEQNPKEKALDAFLKKKYPNSWLGRIMQGLAAIFILPKIPKIMSKKVVSVVLKDLNKSELLEL